MVTVVVAGSSDGVDVAEADFVATFPGWQECPAAVVDVLLAYGLGIPFGCPKAAGLTA